MATPDLQLLRSKPQGHSFLNFSTSLFSHQICQQILLAVLPPKYIKIRPLLPLNCFHPSPGHRQLSPDERSLHQPPPDLLPLPCVPKSLLSSRDTKAILSKGKSDRVSPPMAIQLSQVQAKTLTVTYLKELHDLPPSLPLLTCPHFLLSICFLHFTSGLLPVLPTPWRAPHPTTRPLRLLGPLLGCSTHISHNLVLSPSHLLQTSAQILCSLTPPQIKLHHLVLLHWFSFLYSTLSSCGMICVCVCNLLNLSFLLPSSPTKMSALWR